MRQRVTVCINCVNPFHEPSRCGCKVGGVISVHGCSLAAERQPSYTNIQSGLLGQLRKL